MKTKISLLVFFISIITFNLNAQKPPCDSSCKLLIYGDNMLPKFPVLKMDMPYEAMLFYIWLGEWTSKYNHNYRYFDSLEFNDEFKELIKRMYIATDYDPILFIQHFSYQDKIKDICPLCAISGLISRYKKIVPEPELYWALLEADVIAKVRLINVTERTERDGIPHIHTIVEAEVLDVIKGKTIPTCKDITIPNTSDDFIRPIPMKQINEPGQCIQFNCRYCNLSKEIGKEFIVFIDNYPWCVDTASNYYFFPQLLLYNEQFTYQLMVEDGIVNYYKEWRMFNLGENLTYEEWKERLIQKINDIINKTYTDVGEIFDNNNELILYPNPTDDFINIRINGLNYPLEIKIFNILGYEIEKYKVNDFNFKISLDNYNSGIYFIKIDDGRKVLYDTFIINK